MNTISQQWEIVSLPTVTSKGLGGRKTTFIHITVIIQCVHVVSGEGTGWRAAKGQWWLPEGFTMSLMAHLSVKRLMMVGRLGFLSYHCHVLGFPRRVIIHCIVCFLVFSNAILIHYQPHAHQRYCGSGATMGNCFSAQETHKGKYGSTRCHIERDGLVSPSDSFPILHYLQSQSCTSPPHAPSPCNQKHRTIHPQRHSRNPLDHTPASDTPTASLKPK